MSLYLKFDYIIGVLMLVDFTCCIYHRFMRIFHISIMNVAVNIMKSGFCHCRFSNDRRMFSSYQHNNIPWPFSRKATIALLLTSYGFLSDVGSVLQHSFEVQNFMYHLHSTHDNLKNCARPIFSWIKCSLLIDAAQSGH